MTGVWEYSFLKAGFALTVGPVTGAAAAALGGRLADRFGTRPVAVLGSVLFTAGCLLYVALLGPEVQFLSAYLPGAIVSGAGVGLAFAALTSAAVEQLPGDRYATGTALVTCSRQLGAVLGISGLVALFESATPADQLATFDRAWVLMAIAGALAAATALAVRAGTPREHAAEARGARGELAVGGR
jgi:MFS family permease